jgi:alanine racemase
MLWRATAVREPLRVSGRWDINESVIADTIVQCDAVLLVWGDFQGSLTIERDAQVVIEGFIDGKVTNKGGRLVVHDKRVANVATAGPPEAEAGGILKVNLSAIATNWRALAKCTLAECAAVVKADAYGCGIDPVVAALAKCGCQTFFVSSLAEARRVRAAAANSIIYVLNGFHPGTEPGFAETGARPVISTLVELAEWDAFVSSSGWAGRFALYVDTGTGHGISIDEAVALAGRTHSQNHGVALLMSDLDKGKTPDHPDHDRQVAAFREISRLYLGVPASLADSFGIFCGPGTHFDLVRPGAALYGINPTPNARNPMLPVIELQARIAQVRNINRGETVTCIGWTAKRRSRIALVAVGYADGYPATAAGGSGTTLQAIIAHKMCPIVGRVSMDLMAVDITELPNQATARRGGMITLIGEQISINDFATAAKSTGCEVLSRLGLRFHRIYRAS